MQSWSVQDAKAKFSEFLEPCLRCGPQVVTKRGAEAAVLVPIGEGKRLQERSVPALKEWLLAPEAPGDLAIPNRHGWRRRPPERIE